MTDPAVLVPLGVAITAIGTGMFRYMIKQLPYRYVWKTYKRGGLTDAVAIADALGLDRDPDDRPAVETPKPSLEAPPRDGDPPTSDKAA